MTIALMASRPDWWDIEVETLSAMLVKGMWLPHEVSMIERQIEDRIATVKAGLGSPTQIMWTFKIQKEVDEFCRVRHDRHLGWMLDRFVEELGVWHPVGYVGTGGRAVLIEEQDGNGNTVLRTIVEDDKVRPDLVNYLRAHDMQRPGYIQEKRDAAEAIRDENFRLANERLGGIIDGMSDKRVKEFIQVERAMQTGEEITLRGASRETWNKLEAANLKFAKEHGHLPEAAPEELCDNPGMRPDVYKRETGGKHILEN
jgi:hypothetical protein